MQTPPAYNANPQKRPNWLLWVILAAAAGGCLIVIVAAAAVFPILANSRDAAIKTKSLSNVKQGGVALMLYATDWDDRLPPSDRWVDLAAKGYEANIVLPGPDREFRPERIHHAMNSALSRRELSKIEDIASDVVVTFWSTDPERNANDNLESVNWAGSRRSYTLMSFLDTSARAVMQGRKAGSSKLNGPMNGPR